MRRHVEVEKQEKMFIYPLSDSRPLPELSGWMGHCMRCLRVIVLTYLLLMLMEM